MRLPKLLDELAKFETLDRPTWDVMARKLRDAGLMLRTKRGRGAEHVPPEDVASLVIASLGTNSPVRAPATVTRLRAADRRSGRPIGKPELGLLDQVLAAPTFGEALDLLMSTGPEIKSQLDAYSHAQAQGFSPPVTAMSFVTDEVVQVALNVMGPGLTATLSVREMISFVPAGDNGIDVTRSAFNDHHTVWKVGKAGRSMPAGWITQSLIRKEALFDIASLARQETAVLAEAA